MPHDAIIIGTGFSGMCAAIALARQGVHDVVLLEKADEVGGTWRDNTYPGIACDIPSHLYSFSFAMNPDWTRKFPQGPEIQRYLRGIADRFGVREKVRFGAEVERCVWDPVRGLWTVHTSDGEERSAPILMSGIGLLHFPRVPDFPGRETFAGPAFHTARWDHDVDLQGKRVAVIGTGASAIQVVPEIVDQVEKLVLFQRTPPWVVPRDDRPFHALEKAAFRSPLGRAYRWWLYWKNEALAVGFVGEPRLLQLMTFLGTRHIAAQIRDPALREKVTPTYTLGCKRILVSDDYYPAIQKPQVELVTRGVERLDEGAVIDAEGVRHEVDVVIYATGFEPVSFGPLEIVGEGGRTLDEAWSEGQQAYFGTMVAGFPNLFLLLGPNLGLGHNSMVFMIEAQVHYVMQLVERMRSRGLHRFAVSAEAQRAYNAQLVHALEDTVWASGCASWYLDADGNNPTLWPKSTLAFWRETRSVDFSCFEERAEWRVRRAKPRTAAR